MVLSIDHVCIARHLLLALTVKRFRTTPTHYITYTVHAASLRDMITSKRTEKQTMRYVDGIRTAKRIPVYRSRPTHRRDNWKKFCKVQFDWRNSSMIIFTCPCTHGSQFNIASFIVSVVCKPRDHRFLRLCRATRNVDRFFCKIGYNCEGHMDSP